MIRTTSEMFTVSQSSPPNIREYLVVPSLPYIHPSLPGVCHRRERVGFTIAPRRVTFSSRSLQNGLQRRMLC